MDRQSAEETQKVQSRWIRFTRIARFRSFVGVSLMVGFLTYGFLFLGERTAGDWIWYLGGCAILIYFRIFDLIWGGDRD